jgi:hypothetical protein
MMILTAGFQAGALCSKCDERFGTKAATASAGRANNHCHRFISMVEEPTKTLNLRVSWRFSVFSRRKLLHQNPRPGSNKTE